MKRICLFAGYDNKNIIHDYVVYYIKELSTVADVYYMADNKISDDEKAKITPYVKEAYGFNHKKYDFGSWQELIKIIGWEKISEYDELIIANDSVFGPLYPIKELFEKLEKDRQWDVCGINKHNLIKWHLSSYFLVFRKNAHTSDIFKNHFSNINIESRSDHVIEKYEIPFTYKFYSNGFVTKSYVDHVGLDHSKWKDYILNGMPFIKKKVFLDCIRYKYIDGWREFVVENTQYPLHLMEEYLGDIESIVKKKEEKKKKKETTQNFFRINIRKNRIKINIFGKTLINYEKNVMKIVKKFVQSQQLK